jgi:hypothetical protein
MNRTPAFPFHSCLPSRASIWVFALALLAAATLAPAATAIASSGNGPRSPARRLEVRGIADWDRLKMRLAPGQTSPAVGEIPARAQGVVGTGRQRHVGRAVWHEVEYQGVRGWVHGRFIRPEAGTAAPLVAATAGDGGAVFAEDLVCVGQAPAWKLVIDRDGSTAGSTAFGRALTDVHALAAQPQRSAPQRPASQKPASQKPAPRTWTMTLEDAQGIGVATVTLRESRCTAGNASDVYGYEVTTHQPDGTVLSGCCNRRLEPSAADESKPR